MAHHQAGRLQQALPLYQQAIAADKSNSDAHQFMGLLFLHAGQPEQGIACIRNAIAINKGVAPYHDNLGAALESIGDYEGALASYEAASTLDQDSADRMFGKANALAALGQVTRSEQEYRKAIALNPEDSAFHFNLGNLLKSEGRLHAACECYLQASTKKPEIEGVLVNWGNTLLALRDYPNAIQLLEKAVEKNSKSVEALTALASGFLGEGEFEHAKKRIAQAEAALSGSEHGSKVVVMNLKGKLALQTAAFREAISAYRQVLKIEPDNPEAISGLAATFRWIQPSGYEPELVTDIQFLFEHPVIVSQRFSRLAANQIRHHLDPQFQQLKQSGDWSAVVPIIAGSDLLKSYLATVTNTDAELEVSLILLRQALLTVAISQQAISESVRNLASALAVQLFLNEHVYMTDAEEQAMVSQLVTIANQAAEQMQADVATTETEFVVCVLAMFEPLARLEIRKALLAIDPANWSAQFSQLIKLTVKEPVEEAKIRSEIEPLVHIDNAVSNAVRAQYEQHPYPRWFHLAEKSRVSYHQYLVSLFPYFVPPEELLEPVSVLCAGCGTGQEAAMIVNSKLTKEVVGLDLSATSLAYARRMTTQMKLPNLKFVQGDILQVAELGQRFPVIESTGVLHHMGDPVAGWQTLVDVLQERGMMKVGLYSTRASREVSQARDWIETQRFGSDDETIKKVRATILSADQTHPLYALRHSEDFYSVSACRDLIFHVQESTYTPAELLPILDQLNLDFIGFELPDEKTRARYLSQFPEDKSMTNLNNWDQFDENYPNTFSGMLVFWCQGK